MAATLAGFSKGRHTVFRETLDNSANDHDPGTKHDAPSPTKRIVDQWNEGQPEDGSERKGGSKNATVGTRWVAKVCSLVRPDVFEHRRSSQGRTHILSKQATTAPS